MEKVVVAKFANTTPHGAIKGKKQTHEKEYFSIVKEYLTVKRVFQLVHFLHRFNRKVIEAYFVKYIFQEDEHERENNVHYLHVNGVKKLVHFFCLSIYLFISLLEKGAKVFFSTFFVVSKIILNFATVQE